MLIVVLVPLGVLAVIGFIAYLYGEKIDIKVHKVKKTMTEEYTDEEEQKSEDIKVRTK